MASIDGHDVDQILAAFGLAQETQGRPTMFVAETVKGNECSFAQNKPVAHNGSLTAAQYHQALSDFMKMIESVRS